MILFGDETIRAIDYTPSLINKFLKDVNRANGHEKSATR